MITDTDILGARVLIVDDLHTELGERRWSFKSNFSWRWGSNWLATF